MSAVCAHTHMHTSRHRPARPRGPRPPVTAAAAARTHTAACAHAHALARDVRHLALHPLQRVAVDREAAAREPRIVAAKSGRFGEIVREEFAPAFFHPSPRRTDLVVRMTGMGRALGAEVYLRQARLMQKRKDQQAMLRKSMVPALIVCGTSDPTIPVRRHEFLAELMPKGHLALIDGAGMVPTLEQPEVVTSALRSWLNLPPL